MNNINIKNKKAYFKYQIIDTFQAGIVLKGTEVKPIRKGKINFNDSYCYFVNGELYLKNFHISEYENGTYNNHETNRDRKLLLTKKELKKLITKVTEKGYTIVPLQIYINDKGFVKLSIGLAYGKKEHDKRETIKKRDMEREIINT